ncbi:MAG: acetyl-CoA carboxylase biotin carboxyl carrier protein subunit [Gemmatimonadota bacterium]|nr:acetyl-CoA carboxylase biotin carboxyl carrier protein subunit [Gemmatimonadota bacterium]
MRYIVELNGGRKAVTLGEEGVSYEGATPLHSELSDIEGSPIRMLKIGYSVHRVVVQKREGRGRYTLWIDGYRFEAEALDERMRAIRDVSAAAAGPVGPAPVRAPMPGLIVRVNVKVGDNVQAGQGIVVMEAMKMENELRATAAGTVKSVDVAPGTAVEKGALLVALE